MSRFSSDFNFGEWTMTSSNISRPNINIAVDGSVMGIRSIIRNQLSVEAAILLVMDAKFQEPYELQEEKKPSLLNEPQ